MTITFGPGHLSIEGPDAIWRIPDRCIVQPVFPLRYMLGVEAPLGSVHASAGTHRPDGYMPDHYFKIPIRPRKKESTMIDTKKFTKYTERYDAEDLNHRHIGALVKVKTVDGVEITDVLTGLVLGVPHDSVRGKRTTIYATFEHTATPDDFGAGNRVGVYLEPLSRVTVRYPIEDVA